MFKLALQLIAENKKTKAKSLDLGNCGLREVPEEIGELVWLEKLTFSEQWSEWDGKKWIRYESQNKGKKNRIVAHPSAIAKLQNLKTLIFNGNPINRLNPLAKLTNLRQIYCAFTQVSDLSPLVGLVNLQQLYHPFTQVSDLSPLIGLNNLQQLDCSNTKVSNLSPLAGLINLQQFFCESTLVSDLTPLAALSNLRTLDCSRTKVSSLTPILPLIKANIPVRWSSDTWQGDAIYVGNCPLTTPPPEVVKQGNFAILRYFDEREKYGTDQIYEAKLLLIGEGGAGKTTLCRKLFDPSAELPIEKDSTRGIDIQPLYFDLPNGKQFRLNVWDFAGQGKYQSAHSLFYTHRSIYVLVDDTRTLDENEAYRTFYNYWLQTVELFGGHSPLLVLHNQKADRVRIGFNLGSFQATFPFVKELFRINLGSSNVMSILDLKSQIERWAQKLPHIGDVVPKTWVKIREDIEMERQTRPYISDERYQEICSAHGITDEAKQSDLSHYFHDLGVFLHFQENPLLRRDVFLQNQWVTDAVYKILDDTQISEQKRGRFDETDLARLWNERLYARRRDELLAMMLQFELCYQVQDTETYIAPQLLPGDIPTYDLGTDIPLQIKYEYSFMPKGLLYRLIVYLHRYIAQQQSAVWNSGVVLERAGAKADILESLDRRLISVRATGMRAKELVTIINEEVERLHASYGERLKVEVKIPCNCHICKAGNTPHFYDKKDLENRIVKGKVTVECKESFDDVIVSSLLGDIFKEARMPQKLTCFAYAKTGEKEKLLKEILSVKYEIVTTTEIADFICLDISNLEPNDPIVENSLTSNIPILFMSEKPEDVEPFWREKDQIVFKLPKKELLNEGKFLDKIHTWTLLNI